MTIQSKDWHAQNDRMPSTEGPRFRVRGTVTVDSPSFTPVLTMAQIQDKSAGINLELKFEQEEGMFLAVVTEKQVAFEMPGVDYTIPWVHVFHEGKLLYTIKDIATTY
ncbi:MAG: hypothetical protein RR736_06140 [Pseudomonas sp.]|uniref:hypothetical protein n=1 Tax=Pseudomonas sp. TaxID=306 RepID=UPI002FC91E0F